MASPILMPSADLVTVNPSPSPGAPTGRFVLFTESWLDLQNYVQQSLRLPISKNDFTATYGAFSAQSEITNVVKALRRVSDLSETFGNPSTLKQKIIGDTGYLLGATPPAEIYAHIVWLANQVYNTSTTFQFTMENLPAILGPTGGSTAQRAEALKEILTGTGGLLSSAKTMEKLTGDLLTKLLAFEDNVKGANAGVQDYFGRGSAIVDKANEELGAFAETIKSLNCEANDAYSSWKNYSILTVATSVGLMFLGAILAPFTLGATAGLVVFAHAGGVGFGLAASRSLSQYNALCAQMKNKEIEKLKKSQLVTDVNAFNVSIGNVAPAMTSFMANLQQMQGVWADVSMNLAYISHNYSTSQLSDLSWVMQMMKVGDAQKKWGLIGRSAQEFTQNSLVSYDFSRKFGEPVAA